jgi:hypothetical protein
VLVYVPAVKVPVFFVFGGFFIFAIEKESTPGGKSAFTNPKETVTCPDSESQIIEASNPVSPVHGVLGSSLLTSTGKTMVTSPPRRILLRVVRVKVYVERTPVT